MSQLKTEVTTQLTDVKRESKKKTQTKKAELSKTKQEQEFANEKLCEEIRGLKDKLHKLANQFDKELLDRDRALKTFQNGLWEDIQQLINAMQRENE